MRSRKKNANKISWKEYKSSLSNKNEENLFNECQKDLHTMTMKERDFKDGLTSQEYADAIESLSVFDQTDPDYLNYEKELTIGEFND